MILADQDNPLTDDAVGDGTTNTVRATIGYSLTLDTQAQLDALLSRDTTNFPVSVAFSGGSSSTFSGADACCRGLNVGFVAEASDPTIVTGVSNGRTLAEDNAAGVVVATITFTDPDIIRILNNGENLNDIYGLTGPVLTRTDGGPSIANFLQWSTISYNSSSVDDPLTATLSSSRLLTDADVGTYSFTWTLTDTRSDGGGTFTSSPQSFTLTVTRVEDASTDAIIAFTDAQASDLGININSEGTKSFPIRFSFNDPDFLETPRPSLTSVTYDSVAFTIEQPSDDTSADAISCIIESTSADLFADLSGAAYTTTTTGSAILNGLLTTAGDASLTFAGIKAATNNAACATLEIGSTITEVSFVGVSVAHDGVGASSDLVGVAGGSPGAIDVDITDYTIQGYRTLPHSIAAANEVLIAADGQTTIIATITDGDPDDGVPYSPTLNANPNIIRTGSGNIDNPGSAWTPRLDATLANDCTGKITIDSIGDYVAVNGQPAAATSSVVIAGVTGGVGACTITLASVGEDGASISTNITVRIESAPVFTTEPTFNTAPEALNPDTFNYFTDNITFSAAIATGNSAPGEITVTLASNTGCSILGGTTFVFDGILDTNYPFSSRVSPSGPGLCVVTIVADENGVTESREVTFNFPPFAPDIAVTSITTPNGRDITLNNAGLRTGDFPDEGYTTSLNSHFVVTLNVSRRDLLTNSVNLFTFFAPGACNLVASPANSGLFNDVNELVFSYRIELSVVAESCSTLTIAANIFNRPQALLTIPAGTFNFIAAPILNRPSIVPEVISLSEPAIFDVSVTTASDNLLGTIVTAIVTAGPCTATTSSIRDDGTATINITQTAIGNSCSLSVLAAQDGISSDEEIFTLRSLDQLIAPQISIVGQESPYDFSSPADMPVTLTLRATKQDSSASDVTFNNISITGLNSDVCIVEGISTAADAYGSNAIGAEVDRVVNISVMPEYYGLFGITCQVNFTAVEDGEVSSVVVTASFALVKLAPTLSLSEGERTISLDARPNDTDFQHTVKVRALKNDSSFTFPSNIVITATSSSNLCSATTRTATGNYDFFDSGVEIESPRQILDANPELEVTVSIAFNGPLGQGAICSVNVIVTEDGLSSSLASTVGGPIVVTFDAVPVSGGLSFAAVNGGNAVQAASNISVNILNAGSFKITDNLRGCDLVNGFSTVQVAKDSTANFILVQNNLTVGNVGCIVNGDVASSGNITITAYAGTNADGDIIEEPLVATAEQILIGNHSVTLTLGNDKSYYLMEEQLRRTEIDGTAGFPTALDLTRNNIYPYLFPKEWRLQHAHVFARQILANVGFTNSSILLNRANAIGSADIYRNPLYFPYATDVFFVNTSGIAEISDVLATKHTIVDPEWVGTTNNLVSLPAARSFNDAGYDADFFATMRSRGIDGYLRFTIRQSVDLNSPIERKIRTFRTTPDLNYMLTEGISANNPAQLLAKVCHLRYLNTNISIRYNSRRVVMLYRRLIGTLTMIMHSCCLELNC